MMAYYEVAGHVFSVTGDEALFALSTADKGTVLFHAGIHAYVALMESISGKRWDSEIADGLHFTQNALASSVPMWHLECLPDEAAAKLCKLTVDS